MQIGFCQNCISITNHENSKCLRCEAIKRQNNRGKTRKKLLEKESDKIKANIGLLRQWLNERSGEDLITNENIENFIFHNIKEYENDEGRIDEPDTRANTRKD